MPDITDVRQLVADIRREMRDENAAYAAYWSRTEQFQRLELTYVQARNEARKEFAAAGWKF